MEWPSLVGVISYSRSLAQRSRRRVPRTRTVATPVIGFLSPGSPEFDGVRLTGVRQGLKESGYVEGQNVAIEYRFAHGQNDRLPALAADLVDRRVAGMVTAGTPATLAARTATTTIPIVFYIAVDRVQFGLAASLSRPGGNLTGVGALSVDLGGKKLEVLQERLPDAAVVAMLVNPTNPISEPESRAALDAAQSLRIQLHIFRASTSGEIDAAFASLVKLRACALVVDDYPYFLDQRAHVMALPAGYAVRRSPDGANPGGRRPDQLRRPSGGRLSPGLPRRGENPQGHPACRSAGATGREDRDGRRSQDRQDAWHYLPLPLICRADEVIE